MTDDALISWVTVCEVQGQICSLIRQRNSINMDQRVSIFSLKFEGGHMLLEAWGSERQVAAQVGKEVATGCDTTENYKRHALEL